ncbi:MAG: immunoglobulin domain-containing protein, partial [Clostridiales bacterium]|nr:immunoglobulin domain-containing protein [Clostridiales bacterium]
SLTVTPAPAAPTITVQPVAKSIFFGQPATFSVDAEGYPAPSYQWQISINGGDWENIEEATGKSYTTITDVSPDISYMYRCYISNSVGNVTSNAVSLTIISEPLG